MSIWQPPRESDYTLPSELCPHPEWWSSENAYATEVESSMLVAALVKATQPEFVVEVGSHYGQTSERISKVITENGHGEFVSLEIDPDLFGSASHRCAGLCVQLININSLEYIPPKPIDFLFVDGSMDRLSDFEHFLSYMSPRGMIVVHDTAAEGYIQQVPRMLELCKGDHIQLDTPRGLLILKVAK